jgi:hypothetical protein
MTDAKPIPDLRIDESGVVTALDGQAREVLGERPGVYKVIRAGSLVLLSLDEGTGAAPRPGEKLAMAGDLANNELMGMLNLFGQNRETGRLVLKRGPIERVIMLRDGDVASVGSNAPEDRLGQFLQRLGTVDDAQLEAANAEVERTGKRIGQVLMSQGLLDAHKLWSTIQQQITEIFSDVVQWEEGSYVLFRLPEDFPFPSTPPMQMQGLLLEAVRRADELNVFRSKIPSRETALKPTGKPLKDSLEDIAKEAFGFFGERGATVADIARAMHITEFEATRVCYELLKAKAVEISEIAPAPERLALSDEQRERLDVYNLAFREIYDEVERAEQLSPYVLGVQKFLDDPTSAQAELFKGVTLDATGGLPADRLVENLTQMGATEPMSVLQEALNELTFFMLFQCGEFLDAKSDENLGRRVRLIHAALGKSA